MTYRIIWTGNNRVVSSVAEVDAALDEAATASVASLPVVVTVLPAGSEHLSPFDDDFPDSLEVGIGHPDRGFVRWMGDGGGYGYEPGLSPGPDGLRFDYGGQPVFPEPDELRVTPVATLQAVRDFISTGTRPAHLLWRTPMDTH